MYNEISVETSQPETFFEHVIFSSWRKELLLEGVLFSHKCRKSDITTLDKRTARSFCRKNVSRYRKSKKQHAFWKKFN